MTKVFNLEIYGRDVFSRKYGFPHKWQYSISDKNGKEVCWGISKTYKGVKKIALKALNKRLKGKSNE